MPSQTWVSTLPSPSLISAPTLPRAALQYPNKPLTMLTPSKAAWPWPGALVSLFGISPTSTRGFQVFSPARAQLCLGTAICRRSKVFTMPSSVPGAVALVPRPRRQRHLRRRLHLLVLHLQLNRLLPLTHHHPQEEPHPGGDNVVAMAGRALQCARMELPAHTAMTGTGSACR